MEHNSQDAEILFEIGKLYCERCDFDVAIERLSRAGRIFLDNGQMHQFLECQNLVLRMHAERDERPLIDAIKLNLQTLADKKLLKLNSRTHYILGICASYSGSQNAALEQFKKALALALHDDSKRDICYAINGIAISYYAMGQLTEALKEIYNLQVFFEVMPLTEIRLSSQLLNGHIQRKMKHYDQALEIFWNCYDILREEKNSAIYVYLLWGMALTYFESGNESFARMYLQLAKRSVDPKNMCILARQIDEKLKELKAVDPSDFDLVFEGKTNTVLERRKGRVDFKNQFILLDLLRMFIHQPGQVFSKEALAESVWKQQYDPSVHDNKIYVTIKRLRKMIEPDFDKPKYIFRAKNGYYLNKSTRILMDQ